MSFLMLMTSGATPLPEQKSCLASTYESAINATIVIQGSDRRNDLRRCIKHWGMAPAERTNFLHNILGSRAGAGDGLLMLEIGNSGFPRYDYVYVENKFLKSSFGDAKGISGTPLAKRISEIYAHALADLRGTAYSEVDDGDCYFLTIEKDGVAKGVAMYGPPDSTATGSLIKDMLEVAHQKAP